MANAVTVQAESRGPEMMWVEGGPPLDQHREIVVAVDELGGEDRRIHQANNLSAVARDNGGKGGSARFIAEEDSGDSVLRPFKAEAAAVVVPVAKVGETWIAEMDAIRLKAERAVIFIMSSFATNSLSGY